VVLLDPPGFIMPLPWPLLDPPLFIMPPPSFGLPSELSELEHPANVTNRSRLRQIATTTISVRRCMSTPFV